MRIDEVVKDDAGNVTELRGWLDPDSRPGMAGAERKIKGTIHWVSAMHAVAAEIPEPNAVLVATAVGGARRRRRHGGGGRRRGRRLSQWWQLHSRGRVCLGPIPGSV